ncbi:MAG: DNA polymerase III subunit delta [Acidimicrobiales bacterium]
MNVNLTAPVFLLKGNDDVILGSAVSSLIDQLVGDGDRTLLLAELSISDHALEDGGYTIGPVVDASQTFPFLSDRRVVLVRNAAVFSTKDACVALVHYLTDPLETTSLVLVWEKDPRPNKQAKTPAVPKSLLDAITGCGGVVEDSSPGTGKAQSGWLEERITASTLRFDPAARRVLVDHLGSDVGRLPALLEMLESVFGPGTKVSAPDIEPYLGVSGDVAPWDLTDAIDGGDVSGALDVLNRMMIGGDRHPLQLLATLVNHYLRMIRLDDPDLNGERQAADVLGMKGSTFPAKKALDGAKRLGSDRLAEIADLLAQADLDLHGTKAWPPELVVEVLVARLAGRNRSSSKSAGQRRR